MTKVKEKIRTDVTAPFIWQNPVFSQQELREKGEQYADCLPRMAQQAIIKRQGTHVYSANSVDQASKAVRYLMARTYSTPTTAERLERHSGKVVEKEALREERAPARPSESAAKLLRSRLRVFDFEQAAEYLGEEPEEVVARLVSKGSLVAVHPGLYRRPNVAEHGAEMLEWIARRSERDRMVQASIDRSYNAAPNADGMREPLRVTGLTEVVQKMRNSRMRIRIGFNHLPPIYAIAGGVRNGYVLCSGDGKSPLTPEAAQLVFAQLLGPRYRWGDLIALLKKHSAAKHDPQHIPQFLPRGRFDERPRMGEKEPRMRYDLIRKADEAQPLLPLPCVLSVDHREDENIVDAMRGIANLAVATVQLGTGDFHARWGEAPHEQVYIERKTGPDFAASVSTGRMDNQLERLHRMRMEGIPTYILTQGNIFDVPPTAVDGSGKQLGRQVGPRTVMAATVDIAAHDVPTIQSQTWQHAAEAVVRLIKRRMELGLCQGGGHPRTDACANQEPTAAERPEGTSSE